MGSGPPGLPGTEGAAIDPTATGTGEPGRADALTEDERRAQAAIGEDKPRRS